MIASGSRHRRAAAEPVLCALLGAMLAACAGPAPHLAVQPAQPGPTLAQPANVGDVKLAATAYHDSGAYDRDLAAVASEAGA